MEVIFQDTIIPDKLKHHGDSIIYDSIHKVLFSRISTPKTDGLFYQYTVDSAYWRKDIEVVFSGRIRTNYAHSLAYINVAGIAKDGVIISWNSLSLKYHFVENNEWCYFKDSIYVRYDSWNSPYGYINTSAYLGESTNEKFDIDSLHVSIKVKT